MKIPVSACCCVLMAVLAVPADLIGQTLSGPHRDWIAISGINPGTNMAVRMRSGETLNGKFNSVSEDSIYLFINGKTLELERDKIEIVWRVGRSLKKPVLLGTVIGAGAGAAVGIAAGGCNPRDIICFDRKATVPIGAAVLGILGAVTGLLVGLGHHRKFVVYQAS